MKAFTLSEIRAKALFISGFTPYNIEIEYGKLNSYIHFNYGCEGSDCVFSGSLSECNRYLNKLIYRNGLQDDWFEQKNQV